VTDNIAVNLRGLAYTVQIREEINYLLHGNCIHWLLREYEMFLHEETDSTVVSPVL
jgi:hypothetical protein